MNKSVLIAIPVVFAIAIFLYVTLANEQSLKSEDEQIPIYGSGFTYYDIENIQATLLEKNIHVSKPTPITDHTIVQYCPHLDGNLLPSASEYCITTAVLDSEGNSFGNINMGGSVNSPVLAIANLETDNLESEQDHVTAIFKSMIEVLVCECWEEKQSGDYESIESWLDAARTFYSESDKRNIKSKIENLGTSEIYLEITPKDNSVLQTLIILKR